MKAIVQNDYGSPEALNLADVPMPEVKEDGLLVRVRATSINAGDIFTLKGDPWLVKLTTGFPRPKNNILGWDVAGEVEAIGSQVTQFEVGDEVFGACPHTFAEYVSSEADHFAPKPANLSFEQAAAIPNAGVTSLQGVRDVGQVKPGQKVLINGASGGVGSFAVQIAKAMGAEVTGVCSTRNVDLVRSLGADHVVDYTQKDFTHGDARYDVILDNVANHSFSDLRSVLSPDGFIIPNSGHGGMGYVIKAYVISVFSRQVKGMYLAQINTERLDALRKMIEAGQVSPVIDRTYPLESAGEGFKYLEESHAQGKVVLTV